MHDWNIEEEKDQVADGSNLGWSLHYNIPRDLSELLLYSHGWAVTGKFNATWKGCSFVGTGRTREVQAWFMKEVCMEKVEKNLEATLN